MDVVTSRLLLIFPEISGNIIFPENLQPYSWASGTNFLLTYQIWCKYFDPRPRYSLITKFKMAAVGGSFLLPVMVLITRPPPGSHSASAQQISSKSCIALLSYYDSTNFQHGLRPPYWIFISAWWTTHEGALVAQRRCQNLTFMCFVCVVFHLLQFKFFVEFAGNSLYQPIFEGFWGA